MTELIHLLPDEEVLSATPVPFHCTETPMDVAGLADLMTSGFTRMPLAAHALDDAPGEGRFEAEFARDALITSAVAYDVAPALTAVTVRRLAEVQGVTDRTEGGTLSDREQIGRIPHEVRHADDPVVREFTDRFGWQWPYFGSVDATPLFISAAAHVARQTPSFFDATVVQSDGQTRTIGECVTRAIAWLVDRLQSSPMQLLETTAGSNGCWQVWRDSPDAYHHADGALARGSVAAIEVQGFAFDALLDSVDLVQRGLISLDENDLWVRAQELRRSTIEHAWVRSDTHGEYFAAGIERNGTNVRPLAVRTANMALLLNSSIFDGSAYDGFVDAIVAQLTDVNGLRSPSGIRTLAAGEARFRQESYHNGTVWPWQNFWIAEGLRHHNRNALAAEIDETLQHVCTTLNCAPEFVQGGNDRQPVMNEGFVELRSPDGHGGTFDHLAMQPAQKIQTWTLFALHTLQYNASDAISA